MSSRIATAALTGRIYMGRVNKAGTDFVGQKTDVTSDVMKAIIDKAEHHGDGGFDIVSGDRQWTVNVTKRATTDKTPPADSVTAPVQSGLVATMLDALRHAQKVLNHNNLHLECGPVNAAILAARAPADSAAVR